MQVKPDPYIACIDLWPPGLLTTNKLEAYKRLIHKGDIRIKKVTHHEATGYTTVEYWSSLPHAWTCSQLAELAAAAALEEGKQMKMEGIK